MAAVKYFTEDHEWISVENGLATVGITNHAQEQLGDIVFVELPEAGTSLSKGGAAAVIESVKAASDVYAPIDGEVAEVNGALADDPAKVNGDAEGAAWLWRMTVADDSQFDGLMDEAAYQAHIA
ncbi:MAG: glycine cleavage system protein GcvH [Rhizobiaceae bacterium]